MTLQQRIARFIEGYHKEGLRQKVWDEGRKFFTDAFGVMVAGCEEPAVKIAKDFYLSYELPGESVVLGKPCQKAGPLTAARLNGMACHVHDFDDNSLMLLGHPSCVVLPAVLAAGEIAESSSEEAVLAYIMGVDITVMLAKGLFPEHYTRGWHSTATLGIFGAAAAASKLLALTEEECCSALGLAASGAAGVRGNNGSMGKCWQAGNAAQEGVACALLAKRGFVTNPTAMDGTANYLFASSGEVDFEAIDQYMKNMESEFDRPGMAMKLYPCCKATHTSIDMIKELKGKYGFAADDIERIIVGAQPVNIDLLKYVSPQTKFEGKFSMNYTVALGAIYGNAALKDFMGDKIEDEAVIAFMPKVSMELEEDIAHGQYSNGGFGTRMHVYLKDGRVFHAERMQAHGDPEEPVSFEEFRDKFLDCTEIYMSKKDAQKIFSLVYEPSKDEDIGHIMWEVAAAMTTNEK